MANNAAAYKKQIFALEKKLADAIALVPALERNLADCYAAEDEAQVKKIHGQLTEARDAVPAIRGALAQTDRLYFDAAQAEFQEKSKALRDSTQKKYRQAEAQIRQASVPLKKVLADFVPNVDATIEESVIEPSLAAVWATLDNIAGRKLQDEIGFPPQAVPRRDDQGQLIVEGGY